MAGPPEALVRSLVDGPSPVRSFEWHDVVDSTNRRAGELALAGAPEIALVVADVQSAGRGRAGRSWTAPAGSSLMLSLLTRPPVGAGELSLLPLLTGVVLAETVERFLPGGEVGLKWPNDLLLRGPAGGPWRKAAGILVEGVGEGAAVVGVGCNVDWRGVERPGELAVVATSLAEVAGAPVDRWRLLAAFAGVFANRYAAWCARPQGVLDAYRGRCTTLGLRVRAERPGGTSLEGEAVDIAPSGALLIAAGDGGAREVAAGDVHHVRPL